MISQQCYERGSSGVCAGACGTLPVASAASGQGCRCISLYLSTLPRANRNLMAISLEPKASAVNFRGIEPGGLNAQRAKDRNPVDFQF